jgi:hypothetical protein
MIMSRRDIYYWKCDRPAAFHGTQSRGEPDIAMEGLLCEALRDQLKTQHVDLSLFLTKALRHGGFAVWYTLLIRQQILSIHDGFFVKGVRNKHCHKSHHKLSPCLRASVRD